MPVPIIVALPVLAIPAVALWEAIRPRIGSDAGLAVPVLSGGPGGGSGATVTLPDEAAVESPGAVVVPSPAERLRDVIANLPDEATQAIGAITAALDRRSAGNPIPEGPREPQTLDPDTAPDPTDDRPIPDNARREPVEAGAEPATAIERIRQAIALAANRGR